MYVICRSLQRRHRLHFCFQADHEEQEVPLAAGEASEAAVRNPQRPHVAQEHVHLEPVPEARRQREREAAAAAAAAGGPRGSGHRQLGRREVGVQR